MEQLESLSHIELVQLVRAAQKHNVTGQFGSWPAFVKSKTKINLNDPGRHATEVRGATTMLALHAACSLALAQVVQTCMQPGGVSLKA